MRPARPRSLILAVLGSCAGLALGAAPAIAGTAEVVTNDDGSQTVQFTAAAGEDNTVDIAKQAVAGDEVAADEYVIEDDSQTAGRGATLTPGTGCRRVRRGDRTVACTPTTATVDLNVATGDGDDAVRTENDIDDGAHKATLVNVQLGAGDDLFTQSRDAAVDDQVFGEGGRDGVYTSVGNDYIDLGPDDDSGPRVEIPEYSQPPGADGSDGNDFVYGGGGDDLVMGGDGVDRTDGEAGNDQVIGGAGDDTPGPAGSDTELAGVYGGPDNDTLEDQGGAGGGADLYDGGPGNDVMNAIDGGTNDVSPDVFKGGDGSDTVSYANRQRSNDSVDVSLNNQADDGATSPDGTQSIEQDNVGPGGDVENVTGTDNGEDLIVGNDQNNVLKGGAVSLAADEIHGLKGDDTLNGGFAADLLYGDEDADTLHGGDGFDQLYPGTGPDVVFGEKGGDTVFAQDGFVDTISCGSEGDVAYVDANDNIVSAPADTCEAVIKPGAGNGAGNNTNPANNPNQANHPNNTAPGNLDAALLGQVAAALAGDLGPDAQALARLHILGLLRKLGFGAGVDAVTPGQAEVDLDGVRVGVASTAKKIRIAKGKSSFSKAGRGTVKVKLTKKGKRLLRHARKVNATLTLRFTTSSGKVVKRSKKVKLKR